MVKGPERRKDMKGFRNASHVDRTWPDTVAGAYCCASQQSSDEQLSPAEYVGKVFALHNDAQKRHSTFSGLRCGQVSGNGGNRAGAFI